MINYYDSVYDKAMTQSLTDNQKTKAAAAVLKVFHETVWTYIRKYVINIQNNYIQLNVYFC